MFVAEGEKVPDDCILYVCRTFPNFVVAFSVVFIRYQ